MSKVQDINFMIRCCVGYNKHNYPIEIVDNNQPPKYVGNKAYYTTIGGKPIYYPNAYNWPKIRYNSTLRIQVGRVWLDNHKNISRCKDGTIVFLDTKTTYKGCTVFEAVKVARNSLNSYGLCKYIINGNNRFHSAESNIKKAILEAIKGWKKQRQTEKLTNIVNFNPSSIWVSIDDSLKAGNCKIMTELFAKQCANKLNIEDNNIEHLGAMRADVLLAVRDDIYTRRACIYAAQRNNIK